MKHTPILLTSLLLTPTYALAIPAQIDFTQVVQSNAMLIILFGMITIAGGIGVGKYYLNKLDKKLEDKTKKAEEQEDRAYGAELKLKDQEIKQLKERLDKVESEHNSCNRTLPLSYVTRAEYDKFSEQHRTDINGITIRLETMIKDLRNEIKEDMQGHINNIITLLKEKLDK